MKRITTLLGAAFIISILSLGGCVSVTGSESVKDATQENIKQRIIVGKSTKADVKRELGEPMTQDWDDGKEHWHYSYSTGHGSAASYLPIVGLFAQHVEVHSRGVDVYFRKNGIVSDVQVTQTNANIHNGLGS